MPPQNSLRTFHDFLKNGDGIVLITTLKITIIQNKYIPKVVHDH